MNDGSGQFDLGQARVCAVMNAGSGRRKHHEISRTLNERIAPACGRFEIRVAKRGRDLPDLARRVADEGFDLVIAVGGDGTQSAVAGALAGSDTAMGVLPGGTFNYFARDLGVGETIEDGIDTILNARKGSTDLGEVNGLVFLNNISLGAYPQILKTREGIYRRWGRSRIAAYWSVAVALRRLRRPMQLTAHVDGQERSHTSALVFVARSAYQLETFGLEGADAIRDGKMVVLIAKASRAMPLFRSALRLAFGHSARDEDFEMIVTDSIEIETPDSAQLVAHDGEKTRLRSPFRLKVRQGALRVLLPVDGQSKTTS
ncbi:diacylglycerol kinase family protein [Paracoccus sp. 1_MG-2023]|uniref:diacylglycerol/lipid kinase family protein n=1 Tax=unclassified Paracoccus (in: a-proteobacteria) TaxID=2688777 RepID=UPI002090270A|nr:MULTISPECIES: diacylglycerol kinase family protein [unclassified Paracoccus (in: a-proteobacteria)]MDO6667611.1 diacylglycerol kinase family protein [Paracoccus sp. 1_MG-2023]